ncbi:MAG: cell division protein ZipA [Gammaproteobacteria bacterium]|nr:cell division protein ZipA [Gammaproteobacteria bacterium]
MESDLRHWLLIIGPLIVFGVILHGYFRMRSGNEKIKMDLDKSFLNKEKLSEGERFDTEFPNGGARVVENINLGFDEQESEVSEFENHLKKTSNEEVIRDHNTDLENIIALNIFSDDRELEGQQLLETVVDNGMVFGDMEIFHKFDSQDKIIYSLASAVEPGTFNISQISEFSTPGITMFMRIDGISDSEKNFEDMLDLAERISSEFDAQIYDETRSVLTRQTVEHIRQKIRNIKFKEIV